MYIRTENHRSEESTESRKKKDKEKQTAIQESLLSEEERLVEIETSTKKFDYGFHEFDEKEIDGLYINNPERAYIAEDIKVKFINMLSSVQSRIVELRAKGVTQNEIAEETGLTKDQVRTHLKKIDIIASEIQMDN